MKLQTLPWCLAAILPFFTGCNRHESNSGPAANASGSRQNETPKRGMIGLSVLTLTNPFFKQIADSMTEEARKAGFEVSVVSGEFDVARQQNQIKDFIVRKAAAIVLCPCDSKSIGPAIAEANEAGIPVFTADIACLAPGVKVVSHIATDNYSGGKEAAAAMIEALGEAGGKIAILDHKLVESCILRTKGFKEVIESHNRGRTAGRIEIVAELPGGAEAGEAICIDPDIAMISFTGSSAVGRRIGELAGKHLKRVQLELGGKNAVIVLDDADLDAVASAIAFGAWFHQGQICMTTGLVIAHEKIVDVLTEKLVAKAKHLPVGDPTSGQVALGPVISRSQVDRIHGIVKDTVAAGAKLSAGGTFDGPFYRPTVLSGVKPGMRAFDEEVFGPVAAITPFASEDEAVALANSNEYGLSAGVFSQSVGRALALGNRLRTGILHINDQTVADEPHIPFGGTGASGNGTRIGGPANWEEFTNWQWVTIKDKPNPYPF
jgi:DNA-binding LacI/PurR family transcriptional regulator